jgi:hypothetical protein
MPLFHSGSIAVVHDNYFLLMKVATSQIHHSAETRCRDYSRLLSYLSSPSDTPAMNIFPFNVPVFTFEMLPAMNGPVGATLKVLIARFVVIAEMDADRTGRLKRTTRGAIYFWRLSDAEPACESPMPAPAR